MAVWTICKKILPKPVLSKVTHQQSIASFSFNLVGLSCQFINVHSSLTVVQEKKDFTYTSS